jgi:asparagine synthase (glutamine-hydrolysing)
VPLARWVTGDLGRYAEGVWHDMRADEAGVLDRRSVAGLFSEHRSGRADRSQLLFALVMFALWWGQRP